MSAVHACMEILRGVGWRHPLTSMCGRDVRIGSGFQVTWVSAEVTCKSCRRSRAWPGFTDFRPKPDIEPDSAVAKIDRKRPKSAAFGR